MSAQKSHQGLKNVTKKIWEVYTVMSAQKRHQRLKKSEREGNHDDVIGQIDLWQFEAKPLLLGKLDPLRQVL